LKVCIQHSVP